MFEILCESTVRATVVLKLGTKRKTRGNNTKKNNTLIERCIDLEN